VNVLDEGAVPAGSVSAWNSGVASALDARTPGLCCVSLVPCCVWACVKFGGFTYTVCSQWFGARHVRAELALLVGDGISRILVDCGAHAEVFLDLGFCGQLLIAFDS
jgi:hypothetical protein